MTLSNRHEEQAFYDFTVPALRPWSHVVKKGQILRIFDLEGCQAVDTLFYNSADPSERYSAQDTALAVVVHQALDLNAGRRGHRGRHHNKRPGLRAGPLRWHPSRTATRGPRNA